MSKPIRIALVGATGMIGMSLIRLAVPRPGQRVRVEAPPPVDGEAPKSEPPKGGEPKGGKPGKAIMTPKAGK